MVPKLPLKSWGGLHEMQFSRFLPAFMSLFRSSPLYCRLSGRQACALRTRSIFTPVWGVLRFAQAVSRQARCAQGFVQLTLRHTDPGEKDHGGKQYSSGPITEAAVLLLSLGWQLWPLQKGEVVVMWPRSDFFCSININTKNLIWSLWIRFRPTSYAVQSWLCFFFF